MRRLLIATSVALLFGSAAGNATAGLTYVSATRTLRASTSEADVVTFAGAGRFDRTIGGESDGVSGGFNYTDVGQSSTLGPTSIVAGGHVDSGSSDLLVRAGTGLDATFDVDEVTRFRLTSGLRFSIYFPNGELDSADDPLYSLTLRRVGGASLVDVSRTQHDVYFSSVEPIVVDESGVLAPGRYELHFQVRTQTGEDEERGTYDLRLTTSSGAHAVPLPPAAYAGLLTLGGVAGGRWRSGRRRRRLLMAD